MSGSVNINPNKILTGSDNYFLWYDYITWIIRREGLIEYILSDKIKNIDIDNPNGEEQTKILMNNGTVRTILIDSMSPQIQSEIDGINSAYDIMIALKQKYEGSIDYSYWISKLNKLHTNKKNEIMSVLNQMKDIYSYTEKYQLKFSENKITDNNYDNSKDNNKKCNNHVKNNEKINKDKYYKYYEKMVYDINNFSVPYNNNFERSIWLYDSGAGEHLTNNKNLLINYRKEKIVLRCANGTPCAFEGYGEFHFYINSTKIILKRVLYSKEVTRNIISGIELAKTNVSAVTTKDSNLKRILFKNNEKYKKLINDNRPGVIFLDKNLKIVGNFFANKNNEVLITAIHTKETKYNIKRNIFNINKLNNESKLIWHRRLGHYYIENIEKYLNLHKVKNILCDDCKISKMKRVSHNKETPKANDILDVIHSDIIGPINESYNGMKYIITFIDEASHKNWIFLMKRKNESTDIIIKFLKLLNNLFDNKKVKVFKSDNAREYKNKNIIKFCEDNGIRKVYSPPYSPENNGIAERFNQTLISCAKTLLSWSKLSENFWDFAVLYASYLYNKTPHQISKNNVPDESFYGHKIKLDHLKTFGCITYYKNYDQNKSKFQNNSCKGIFLGFDEQTYSYIIMDYNNFKLHYVREIHCLEEEPANISLSNSITNKNEYPTFFKFDFNFSKYKTINKDFFIVYNNKNSENFDKTQDDENDKKGQNSNNITENNNNKNENIDSKDKSNDNKIDDNSTTLSDNENENFYSADENDFENFSKNNEKNFNNKKFTIFDSKNDNINSDKNNNNLNSNILINENQINENQNNNNLSSNNLLIENNNEQNNLNNNNFNNNIQNNNNLSSDKNLINNSNLNNNNLNNFNMSNNNNLINNQTLNNNILNNDTYSNNNNTNKSQYNNYIDNILGNNNNNILTELNSNNNSNFNSNQLNDNIRFSNTTGEEVINKQKNTFNNSKISPNPRKTLIINDNNNNITNNNNVTPDYDRLRRILARNRFYKPNKNPFHNTNVASVETRRYKRKPFNIKFTYKKHKYSNKKVYHPYKLKLGIKKRSNKFVANIVSDVPLTYSDAINSDEHLEWEEAIADELQNLYDNKIFTFVKYVPKGKNLISTRWIFTNKYGSNNTITKRKARVVARGYKQRRGIDFELTYSPTLNIDALKLIIALAANMCWDIIQLDIKAAYLNAKLDIDIYTTIPPGDTNFGKGFWKLNKALYGLRQSGRQWNITITNFLIKNGYTQLISEKCIFKKIIENKLVCIIGLYVDDMIITGENYEINEIINIIKNNFKISKAEPINYILGIKVEKENNNYIISQIGFIEKLLQSFNIKYTRKTNTPCVGDNIKGENNKPFNITTYKSAIGSLTYLAKCTRPDISFAVGKAARNSEHPTISDWIKVTNILKYLNTTKNYKICYDGKGEIIGYTDSDFAGDIHDRKSTSGNIILMGNNPICWMSKKQSIVATSTAEAEYVSTSECVKKILWIRNILQELFNYNKPIKLYTDNIASKTNIENDEINPKLKHIAIKYFFDKDNIQKGKIKLLYVDTKNMLADVFTKVINGSKMLNFANKIFHKKN